MPEKPVTLSFYALFVLLKDELVLKRIRLTQDVQNDLSGDFAGQAETFLNPNLKRVDVEPLYTPGDGEIFAIRKYPINELFQNALKAPEEVPDLELNEEEIGKIKSIVGGFWDPNGNKATIYFQAFNRAKMIEPRTSFFLKDKIFQRLDTRGIRLDDKLVAVYKDNTLLFYSASIKSFLDISDYYQEATDAEIKTVLKHPLIDTENVGDVLSMATTWMRKQFSGIIQSKVLDVVSAREIKKHAKDFGIEIKIMKKNKKESIQFPKEKSEIKDFLKLMNEEYFMGILTNKKFETNSKRGI
jgi:hypothetical protein